MRFCSAGRRLRPRIFTCYEGQGKRKTMRILVVSAWFPYPPSNGSKQRAYNLIRQLGSHHDLTLLSFDDGPETVAVPEALRALCARVERVAWRPFDRNTRPAYRGLLHPAPRSLVATFSPEMARRIEETLSESSYGAVVACQLTAAAYAPYWHGVPALFEEVELTTIYERFARADSLPRRLRHWLTWFKLRLYLRRLLTRFRACTVVSSHERALLSVAVPGFEQVEIVPNGVHLPDYGAVAGVPEPGTLIFTGALSYAANYDAMRWFAGEALPLIRAKVPDVRLTITGDAAGRSLAAAGGVIQTGFVADVRPLVASSWISLAPIREGGGTRVKILESMALGTPVVATSKGAEGLAVTDGTHLFLADSPALFAERVVQLLRDPSLRSRLAANARRLVATQYDWAVIGARLEALVERVAASERVGT
jgi:glycosyltransferase involved in cell wall biosynthesis